MTTDKENKVEIKLRSFDSKILYMNGMYKLPIAPYPSIEFLGVSLTERLAKFKKVMGDELQEIDEVWDADKHSSVKLEIDVLTEFADLLGDMTIFCYSEAAKFGIPMSEVLSIIMDSNFSKLGADGQPIIDADGKFQKGPFYWKPEEKIKELLLERINEAKSN